MGGDGAVVQIRVNSDVKVIKSSLATSLDNRVRLDMLKRGHQGAVRVCVC